MKPPRFVRQGFPQKIAGVWRSPLRVPLSISGHEFTAGGGHVREIFTSHAYLNSFTRHRIDIGGGRG